MTNQLYRMEPQRVAAIHDMSGFGRCSLTVILPTMSTMGMQVVPVPTAILSAHTGGLGEVAVRDLTDYINPALEHYKRLGIGFDCIYSGFLGSAEQIGLCRNFFETYPDAMVVVDPVMGDHGKAYRTCTPELQKGMGELVCHADIITPNLTEVCILLGQEYPTGPLSIQQAKSMLVRLGEMGPRWVVMTGINLETGILSNLGYEHDTSRFWRVDSSYVPVSYPGTGDIFASVFTGGLLGGDSFPIAMERATRFVEVVIKTTYSYGTDTRYGVLLEKSLRWLIEDNLLIGYKPL